MRQIRLELSVSKQVSTAHPITTQNAKVIALMAAAINAVLKGKVDEQFERSRDGDCLDDSNQIGSSNSQHGPAR
jgi:uncharacterized protein YdeI (YjbR/CyaY-like superfamily)